MNEIELNSYLSFYIIELSTKRIFKIFCLPAYDNYIKQLVIDFSKTSKITLGNNQTATISCSNSNFKKNQIELTFIDNSWYIENKNVDILMFINNILEIESTIMNGEQVFIDGIIFYIIIIY